MLGSRIRTVAAAAAAAGVLMGVGAAMALLSWEIQITLLVLVLTIVAAMWLIPRAVAKEPTVSVHLLGLAVAAKVVGALARYAVLQVVYGGVGDAVGYHSAGRLYAPMVRALDFSFIDLSTLGTPIVGYFTAFLYAVITPSMPAAFLVFSMLSLIGTWCFYRAHRISFPDGNHRLYFLLLFFLPTLVYWPSSLGKDALVILGLGLATLGVARIYQRPSAGAFVQLLAGMGLVLLIREAVALMLLFGVAAGLLIRPGPVRSTLTRPMAVLVILPILAAGLVFAFRVTAQQLNLEQNLESVFQKYETTQENLQQGGSSFEQPEITSPASALVAAGGVLFRPFPWELGSGLGAIAGLEGMVLLALLVTRFPAAVRALKLWRGGMIVTALIMSILLIATLSAFTNFGLLARQRSQAFPFVLMVFTAVRTRRELRRREAAEVQAPVTVERIRRTAVPTAAG
ncbi:MAG TPA: glycosyltransferase family 39 protein [Actinomycetota bacterium]|nr:glycosyltransferase family 39 protein [Actinomycetota bacterium]